MKKIFSKAALNAIEDEHRQRGTLGHGFGPAESFYVVQKGGGTYSYADIARAQQQWQDNEDEPEFVDAKEAPGPPSPTQMRSATHKQRGSFGMPRTQEELELENSTLKGTLEEVVQRLKAFEAHAQDASMAALTQSMISVKAPPAGSAATSDDALQQRLRQLELQVRHEAAEKQKLLALSDKQTRELKRFRHRFDKLIDGAREKDKLKQDAKNTGGGDITGD